MRSYMSYISVTPRVLITITVDAREWFTCTSRCSNHTVTCPVLTVTWTAGGFWRSQDLRCMHSEKTAAHWRLDCLQTALCHINQAQGGINIHYHLWLWVLVWLFWACINTVTLEDLKIL